MSEIKHIYWSQLNFLEWQLIVAKTEKGLCFIGSNQGTAKELEKWMRKRYFDFKLIQDDDKLAASIEALTNYLKGKQRDFKIELDIIGTDFQKDVWESLKAIPYGETRNYSMIADSIKRPKAVRAVGTAIGANPLLIVVPCHRVLGKNKRLTGYRGGLAMKERLIALESAK
ncbi:methylated-DNA--[protein]-cysteine S-methyltransferase [Carnobacterium maltaromaticum]|uniref:methylated-DNA--[protein]-cysteine S-methyltransferase n=1 Tax=Carnobacterium maltaromaticum TaxID=2751 RepID=UPI001876F3DE|nr:methylated-DNA--[protein]-cysteine S-methyltransferase [Carnobacterium maltaromaticum]